jgi:hypothetical protein
MVKKCIRLDNRSLLKWAWRVNKKSMLALIQFFSFKDKKISEKTSTQRGKLFLQAPTWGYPLERLHRPDRLGVLTHG